MLQDQNTILNLTNLRFEEPSSMLLIDANISSPSASTPYHELNNLLFGKRIFPKIIQPGLIELEGIFDIDLNKFLEWDENKAKILFIPKHEIGEKVEVSLTYYLQRGKLTNVSGTEG